MDTIDNLIRKGYRIYQINLFLTDSVRNYFRLKMGLLVEYHEMLKLITVRDAKGESKL